MFLNLAGVSVNLPDGTAFRIANEARPPGSYLFNTILPERNLPTYHVESGSLTIRSTMAGLVGMDSPYPPSGKVDASTFLENTAKIANEVGLTEATLRQLQQLLMTLTATGQATVEAVQNTILNFIDKVVVQPHLDRFEWMRGQALVNGEIDWTFALKNLAVNYGVPVGNFLTARAGTSGYGGSASKFWTDVQAIRRLLKNNVRAIIAHGDTIDVITANPINGLVMTAETFDASRTIRTVTLRRLNSTNGQFSADVGDTVTLIGYNGEGEVFDPADLSKTIVVPFMATGKLLGIGNNTGRGFRIGDGSTEDPNADTAIGYTHIGPTIEGGGRPGRWSNVFTPEHEPYTVRGRAVTNGLPVIEAPEKVVVATTEMPA